MRSYEVARTLFSFLAFCAWSIVVVGVLVALIGAGGGSRYGGAGAGLLAMVPGLSIGIAGLLLVAFVQIGRATVDTAEYSQQMLKVARDQLDVSKQGLKQDQALSQSFAALRQPASTPKAAGYANGGQETGMPNKEEMEVKQPTTAAAVTAENGADHLALAAQVTQSPGEAELDQIENAQPVAVRELGENETEYGGRIITEEDGEFSFSRLSFSSLESAHRYIDELGGGTRKS